MNSCKQDITLCLKYLSEIEFPEIIYGICPNLKYKRNSWRVGRVLPFGRREITKLIVLYRIF
jgi:hypothetical protein